MNQYITTAYNTLAAIGVLETLVLVVGIVYGTILWFRGILPAIFRLGNGLAKRKIAIFAKGDNMASLKALLQDSRLFRENNIIAISSNNDLGKAEAASIYLMYWHDFAEDAQKILQMKRDECALIVYAPYDRDRIPTDNMKDIDSKRHSAVTNFRGRLLNDIVTAMITTSYKKSNE